MIKLTLVDGILIGWLLYGNHLYHSKHNDCGANPQTKFLDVMMHTILVSGYLSIAVYFYVLLSTAIYGANTPSMQGTNKQRLKTVIESLSRI